MNEITKQLVELIAQFGGLAGVAAFIAMIINIAKTFNLPDGAAPKISAGLSLAAFFVLAGLKIFKPEISLEGLDKAAADLAIVGLYILGLVAQMGLPSVFHNFLANARVPLLGKSYSNDMLDN